ncbi:MAG: DHH family phosphoesterase [Lachnospiraceae bacterium]
MKEKVKMKGQLRVYLQWPLILSLILIAANLTVGAIDTKAGAAMAAFTVLYLAGAGYLYIKKRSSILSDMVDFASEYSWVQKRLLSDMVQPYAIADETGRIMWMNYAFAEATGQERNAKRHLQALFPEIVKEVLEDKDELVSVHSTLGDSRYRVDLKWVPLSDVKVIDNQLGIGGQEEYLLSVYLTDETEIVKYRKEIDDQKMVAGLIYLDNYDEALESVEEVRRSLLTALIDRKINKYIYSMNGIAKKLEKDKYFFVIKQQYVAKIEENRFSILEDVKTVNIGNEMAVTLSIGMGMNGDSYSQNYDFARTAIDMALGRGGDQAVIKSGSKIQYFGGKAQQIEKTTRVKARVKAHALRELMETKDRLLIMGHKRGDIDSLGAAVGIFRIATALGKKAHIVASDMTASVKPMMDRFTGSPDYPEDMFLNGEQAAELVDANTLLVVVDVNRPSITDSPELLRMVKTIVVLDHHRQSSEIIDNAVLSYVEPYASSACEMVAEILQYVADGIKMKTAEADAMYAGIVIDTNYFTNQTGVRTFEAAAFLRRCGADITRVRKLFRDNMSDYQAKAEAIRNAEVYKDAFAISECPSEGLTSPTVIGAQAANDLLNINNIRASIVLTQYNGTIFVSARSIDDINVQVMMEYLGGGGHRNVAGAQLTGMTVEDARARIREVISQMLEKGDIA